MVKSYQNIYGSTQDGLEIDLRKELSNTLNGAIDEIRKGKQGLLRRMRRNTDEEPIRCTCRDKQTDEASLDYYCRYCLNMGYLWDERKIVYYKNEDSYKEGKGLLFYAEYDKDISDIDYIVEIKLSKEGEPIIPVVREKYYKITKATPFSADRGRLEFWELLAIEQPLWGTYNGIKNRQYI